MGAEHETIFTLQATVPSLQALLNDPAFVIGMNFTKKSEAPEGNGLCLTFRHGVSMSSWGEKITVLLTPVSNTATQVYVNSRCIMPTQIIDYGKNKKLATAVQEYMQANAARYAAPAAPSQPAARFCPRCGNAVSSDALFCTVCGMKQS